LKKTEEISMMIASMAVMNRNETPNIRAQNGESTQEEKK